MNTIVLKERFAGFMRTQHLAFHFRSRAILVAHLDTGPS